MVKIDLLHGTLDLLILKNGQPLVLRSTSWIVTAWSGMPGVAVVHIPDIYELFTVLDSSKTESPATVEVTT